MVQAAAGGVGTLAVQLAKLMGAGTVIGTASTTRKLDLARRLRADVAVNYTEENWVEQVKNATQGRGADSILQMAGGEIAVQSLQCLAPYGRMVVFGAASGQIVQFSGVQLMYKNQAIIGYWLTSQLRRPDRIAVAMKDLMQYNGEWEARGHRWGNLSSRRGGRGTSRPQRTQDERESGVADGVCLWK